MIVTIVKVTSKGQITLPADIRKSMGLSPGDRVALIYEDNRVTIMNLTVYALETFQKAMEGEAEKAGVHSDDDVAEIIMRMRRGEEV